MRIVIDMQGAQTESRFRGIGRYTMSLAQAIVRNRGDHEIILVLNGLFPETVEPIRAEFDGLLSQNNIRIWYMPGPVRECDSGNVLRHNVAELIREAFIASLQPDVVHISSLFDGYYDDAVTSIGRFDQSTLVTVSLYDLIPLMNPEQYLKANPAFEKYYLRQIEYLKHASLALAISEFSRGEGIEFLGIDTASIVNISTAVDEHFCPVPLNENQENSLRDKFGLTRAIVLYTGGADERKNLARLIRAYAQLSDVLRNAHQLVFAGKLHESNIDQLQREAKFAGLRSNELIFIGYVADDELVQLYNLCKLYVFPSWHEGFGLPALEAMSCGTPVIAANTSSLPEVIENQNALFDPYSVDSIRTKIEQGLTDEIFRSNLKCHGLEQAKKFSWDATAQRAIAAFEQCHADNKLLRASECRTPCRPKLAFISPLPPERTGIANYSAELLPELSRYYDIDVIVAQSSVSDSWVSSKCKIRDVEWFRARAKNYDRVLYHFGNSAFHQHMFALLKEVSGTVVLHDFFLCHIHEYMEGTGLAPRGWAQELYYAHGYNAVWARYHAQNLEAAAMKYPTNLSVLQRAQGVIVHSENSRRMANQWYGSFLAEKIVNIPLLRAPAPEINRTEVRRKLNLRDDDFVVCSFGLLNPYKLSHKLVDAWLASSLARNKECILIFVGENHDSDYREELCNTIRRSNLGDRIRITGWVNMQTFRQYLVAADVGVQLRTNSRGETSAAVLDCMNYGLPTIVNANGSMDDLEDDAVWKLPDEFSEAQMVEALESLRHDLSLRQKLGSRAREIIVTRHAPGVCAEQYFDTIEYFNDHAKTGTSALIQAITSLDNHEPNDPELIEIAQSLAKNSSDLHMTRQLFIDVSATSRTDLKTGIQRVARALLLELIKVSPDGYRVEPVYLTDIGGRWHYRYARSYTFGLLDCPTDIIVDEEIEYQPGDMVLGLDLFVQGLVDAPPYLNELHRNGVTIHFLVFDLLPVICPQFFPPGTEKRHVDWLNIITQYDGAICISKAVADELTNWTKQHGQVNHRPLKISWFHLGADIENSSPSRGIPDDADTILNQIQETASFLMVGTIEPRKGYGQTLTAFERLWAEGVDANLVIVGQEGWKGLSNKMRRTNPETLHRLRQHPELGKNLIWLEGISDEYLERVYAASTCLLAASEGEGFGLPLIEAAQHKLPIIARDIPVFREVAGEHAFYFDGLEPETLAQSLKEWLALYEVDDAPRSDDMPWMTWAESAQQLMKLVLSEAGL